jgi:hypothetical protein
MKYSKELPVWLRQRRWSIYIKMHPLMKKKFGVRNFESFCKMEIHSELYKMTLKFLQYRPKLKG